MKHLIPVSRELSVRNLSPMGANRMDRKIPMARNDLKGIVVLNDARTGVYTVMSVNKT